MSLMYIAIMSIVGIIILSLLIDIKKNPTKHEQKRLEAIERQVELKQMDLARLEKQIENRTLNRSVNLTKLEIEVLNLYDMSNIRIPVDILEDLSNMNLSYEKDMIKFIETQRKYWKLENSKDVFIRKG